MMAGRRGPVLTHGAMARADARGHGTGRHTGPWHGQTHGAMARADTRGHGTGRHTGPWHVLTHGADGPGQRAPSPLTIEDCGIAPPVRAGLPRGGRDDGAPVRAGPMLAGRRGPRADARGHSTGRRTGPWHGPTHASPVHVRTSSETSYSACVHAVIPNPRSR